MNMRVKWLRRGLQSGGIDACDTFSADALHNPRGNSGHLIADGATQFCMELRHLLRKNRPRITDDIHPQR